MGVIRAEQVACLVVVAAFLGIYLYKIRPARRSLTGWFLILLNSVVLLLVGLGVGLSFEPLDWPYRNVIRAVAFALILAVFCVQFALLVVALRDEAPNAGGINDARQDQEIR